MARTKVSEREYLGPDGKIVDSIDQAAGARYTLVGTDGASFDALFGEPAVETTLYAIMGFHTKLGNVANTVLNAEGGGTVKDAAAAVAAFHQRVAKGGPGAWREPGEGVGVTRYDTAIMADCIAKVTGKPVDQFLAKMEWRVDASGKQVQQQADGSWPKGAKTYPAFAYGIPAVRQLYDAAKPPKATADVASL